LTRNWNGLERLAAYRHSRLLLAEDNLINQEVALELLRDAGLEADVAADGPDRPRPWSEPTAL
jgi:CheY-like chemotaxis protein